jgi:hypothetical protein
LKTHNMIFVLLAFVWVAILLPLLLQGDPWSLSYPDYSRMQLFYHEVIYDPTSSKITFAVPNSIHSYFPLTYILSKILSLLVLSPVLTEFVLPPIISCTLITLVALRWSSIHEPWLRPISMYAILLIILSASTVIDDLTFTSVAYWSLLVMLILFSERKLKENKLFLIYLSLLFALVLSDVGPIGYLVVIFIIPLLVHSRMRTLLYRYLIQAILLLIGYQYFLGFLGWKYTLSYNFYLLLEISQLGSLSPTSLNTHLRAVGLPVWQISGYLLAFSVIFIVIPILLVRWITSTLKNYRILLLPAFFLFGGGILRIGNVFLPVPIYVSALYPIFLYYALPVSIFGVILHLRIENDPIVGRNAESFKRKILVIGGISVIALSLLQLSPILPTNHITSTSDSQMWFTYLQPGAIFVTNYGSSNVGVEQFTDLTILFFGNPPAATQYLVTSILPSPYQPTPDLSFRDVTYMNGPILVMALTRS